MAWTNSDGLTIYFGQEEATLANGGEYRVDGLFRVEDEEINLTSLTASPALYTRQIFPWGKILNRVELITDIAATGGGTLSVGFVNLKTGAAIDANGALNAVPTATFAALGTDVTFFKGTTNAGNLVGSVVASAIGTSIGLTANYNTTAFTAGRVRVRLYWYKITANT